jgi:hypothetical protein
VGGCSSRRAWMRPPEDKRAVVTRWLTQRPMQLSADIGADAKIDIGHGPAVVLSPDDARLAFVASGPEQTRRIYVRPLDGLQATALPGTENAETPFFSPDGDGSVFSPTVN